MTNFDSTYAARRSAARADLIAGGYSPEDITSIVDRKLIREAYASLGDEQHADLFIVLRFRPGVVVNAEYAKNRFDEFFRRQMRKSYGPRWRGFVGQDWRGIPVLETGEAVPHVHTYVSLPATQTRTKQDAIARYIENADRSWRKLVAGGSTWIQVATNPFRGNRYMMKSIGRATTDRVLI